MEEVLGEGIEVRAVTAEATLKAKSLDEVTEAEGLVTALTAATVLGAGGHRIQSAMEGTRRDTGSLGTATRGRRK